jgi:hypothetical protein
MAIHGGERLPLGLREGLARRVHTHLDQRNSPGVHSAVPSLANHRGGLSTDDGNSVDVARHDAALRSVKKTAEAGD